MKSRRSAILLGTNPEINPGRSRLHETSPTVIHMAAVVLADRSNQMLRPLLSNCRAITTSIINGDILYEVLAIEGRTKPVILRRPTRNDGFVHQVVAKNRRAVGTHLGNCLPEHGLGIPSLLLRATRRTRPAHPACE